MQKAHPWLRQNMRQLSSIVKPKTVDHKPEAVSQRRREDRKSWYEEREKNAFRSTMVVGIKRNWSNASAGSNLIKLDLLTQNGHN